MSNDIEKFEIIATTNPAGTSQRVSERLEQGWELFGNPFSSNEQSGRISYAQAVIKRSSASNTTLVTEMEYVNAGTLSEMQEKVTARMHEGWKPFGQLVLDASGTKFFQAMTRYQSPEGSSL